MIFDPLERRSEASFHVALTMSLFLSDSVKLTDQIRSPVDGEANFGMSMSRNYSLIFACGAGEKLTNEIRILPI